MSRRHGRPKPARQRGVTGRAALLASCAALLSACGGPEPEPGDRPEFVIADEGDGEGEGEGEGEGPRPPTDFVDFPAAPDLIPRDYVFEEESGPLAGYLTKFYRVRNQDGKDLIKVLNNWKSAKARLLDVPQHNMLIMTETREQMPLLERVLEQIDVVPPQVEIEARVLEILETRGYEYGFELAVDRAPAGDTALRRYGGQFNSNSFLESLSSNAAPFQGAFLDWASVGEVAEEFGDFEFIMRALETEGYAEIVSTPRIVCRSGQKASLRTQTKLPIQDFIQNNNNIRVTTRYENVGVTLEVTPTVVGRDAITVEVKPIVSNVVRFEFNPSAGGIPIPVIAERSAVTKVDIRNGELLVIGGLLDKQTRSDHRGVPILNSIPILGILFSSTDDFEQRTNVVFILRIRILTSAEKARARARIPLTRDERIALEEGEGDEGD